MYYGMRSNVRVKGSNLIGKSEPVPGDRLSIFEKSSRVDQNTGRVTITLPFSPRPPIE